MASPGPTTVRKTKTGFAIEPDKPGFTHVTGKWWSGKYTKAVSRGNLYMQLPDDRSQPVTVDAQISCVQRCYILHCYLTMHFLPDTWACIVWANTKSSQSASLDPTRRKQRGECSWCYVGSMHLKRCTDTRHPPTRSSRDTRHPMAKAICRSRSPPTKTQCSPAHTNSASQKITGFSSCEKRRTMAKSARSCDVIKERVLAV